MVTVAIAGPGSVGNHIVRACLSRGHTVITLSRSPKPELSAIGAKVVVVDSYDSIPALTEAVAGADAVISCLFGIDEDATVKAQLNLLEAAKTVGARRFAPSEFAYSKAGNQTISGYAAKMVVWDALKGSGLEHTAFRNGQFLNYLAHGSLHPDAISDGFAGAPVFAYCVDIGAGTAEVPGTGDEKVTMIRTQDVGKFVAAAIELEAPWPEELGMAGSVTSYNEVVREAERITGKKLEVTHRSAEALEEMIAGEANPGKEFYLHAMLAVARGEAYVEPNLNTLVDVTAIKPWTMTEFLEKWWGEEARKLS